MTNKQVINVIINCFKNGGKLLIIGNGGSAAMSQHMAAEFVCKMEKERRPLPAIALTTDTSILTAISNDFEYFAVFERQIQALGKKGDLLIVFTTSTMLSQTSHSYNLWRAIVTAKEKGLEVIMAPRKGSSTAKIQEYQLSWMHSIVREVELAFV